MSPVPDLTSASKPLKSAEALRPAHTHDLPQLISYLEGRGLTRGYAPYFDAQTMTYISGFHLLVRPIEEREGCHPSLCGGIVNTLSGWYSGRGPGPTFVVVDPLLPPFTSDAMARFPAPSTTLRTGRFTIHVFPDDIARTFGKPG